MPDELQTADPVTPQDATPPTGPTSPEAASPTEPARAQPARDDDLAAGLRQRVTLKADEAGSEDAELEGEPADGSPPAEPESRGRRATAAEASKGEIERLRAENGRLASEVTEREQRVRQEEAEQRTREWQTRQQELLARVSERLGDRKEGEYLLWAKANGKLPDWDTEQLDKAERWEQYAEATQAADLAVKGAWAAGYHAVSERPGVKADELIGLPGDRVLPYAYDAGYSAGKAEAEQASKERISQLEGEMHGLRARSLGATNPSPERGGQSAGGWDRDEPPANASSTELMRVGLERRMRSANGRSR